jgi:hypothetical protein
MRRLGEISSLVEQSKTGVVENVGSLEDAQEAIGFSFGLFLDKQGKLLIPGPINEAMTSYILKNKLLRKMHLTLQEELAVAVISREPAMESQITSIKSMKQPFKTYNTREVIEMARPGLEERKVKSLAVIAFRYHQPRAAAQVKKAGFNVVIPDMSDVGTFDANSYQWWTRDRRSWAMNEQIVIPIFALLNYI